MENKRENPNFNKFIDFTHTFNGFTYTKDEALKDLKKLLDNNQLKNFNFINYEKLFYIDIYYSNDDDVQFYLKQIKQIIADNWYERQIILNRLNSF